MITSIFLAFVALGIALGVVFVGYGGVFLLIIGLCCASVTFSYLAATLRIGPGSKKADKSHGQKSGLITGLAFTDQRH